MSSVPKGKRSTSKHEFDSIHYRIHDEAASMVDLNFHAKADVAKQNQQYIQNASKALMGLVWDLVYHIKIRKEHVNEIRRCKRERTFSTGERVNGLY
jgi:hypothetical protein